MEDQSKSAEGVQARKRLYFLVGAQRSGSTLLRLMLDHHPQVACLHEFNFALLAANPDNSSPDAKTLKARLEQDRQYRYSGLSLDSSLTYGEQVNQFLEDWRQRDGSGKPNVGVTIHFRYDLARLLWPDACFIHLVRDPRDVAPSVINMGWAGTAWHATDRWLEAEQEVDRYLGDLPPDRFARVRFEDLVAHPERELTKLCKLLDIDYDPAMLSYPEDTSYPAPDVSAAQRWRGKMAAQDVRQVEAKAGDMLSKRGYQPSGEPSLEVSGLHQLRLDVKDRLGRLRFRMQRYGAGPVLGNAVASRLGMSDTSQRLEAKMQDEDQRNLR